MARPRSVRPWYQRLPWRRRDETETWFDDLPAQLREVGRNLLTIEINTTVKPTMTARKMRELPHALLDVAEAYADKLDEIRASGAGARGASGTSASPRPALRLGKETFEALAREAQSLRGRAGVLADDTRILLYRIERNSQDLAELVATLREAGAEDWAPYLAGEGADRDEVRRLLRENGGVGPRARPEQINRVRKIWDVGTEFVRAQTLIQLDGDVVTRVAPAVVEDAEGRLLRVHQESVGYALSYWSALFAVLHALAGRRARAPAGRPGGRQDDRDTPK